MQDGTAAHTTASRCTGDYRSKQLRTARAKTRTSSCCQCTARQRDWWKRPLGRRADDRSQHHRAGTASPRRTTTSREHELHCSSRRRMPPPPRGPSGRHARDAARWRRLQCAHPLQHAARPAALPQMKGFSGAAGRRCTRRRAQFSSARAHMARASRRARSAVYTQIHNHNHNSF